MTQGMVWIMRLQAKAPSLWYLIGVVVLGLTQVGCELGQVEQGRAIQYDRSRGVVTLILDSNPGGPPRYDRLPPVEVRVPVVASEMGPEPVAGKLLRVETSPCQLSYFDESQRTIHHAPCSVVEQIDHVPANDPRVAHLPEVDRERKTVKIYWPQAQRILVLSVPDQYLDLPLDTWQFGDEIRYYFKQPGQALRMMNVTRTRLS